MQLVSLLLQFPFVIFTISWNSEQSGFILQVDFIKQELQSNGPPIILVASEFEIPFAFEMLISPFSFKSIVY